MDAGSSARLFVLGQTEADAAYVPVIDALVVSACVLSELVGAPWSSRALERAGEARRARTRLIGFLQEEFIDSGDAETFNCFLET